MRKFLKIFAVLAGIVLVQIQANQCKAQSINVGIEGVESKWTASGSFTSTIDKLEKISLTAVGRYDASYIGESLRNMILGNIGYKITSSINAQAGAYYSFPSGLAPIVAVQYLKKFDHLSILLFPNLIMGKPTSMLSFFSVEYTNSLSQNTDWFVRIQPYMVNSLHSHYFTSIRIRTGVNKGKIQAGFAINNDFTGFEFAHKLHAGLFLNYQIL